MSKTYLKIALLTATLITLAITPAAQGSPAPLSIDVGTGSTDMILQNMSNTTANVVVEYLDQSGNASAISARTIPSKGAIELKASDMGGLGGSWIGSATASSDQQLAVVAITQWTGGSNGDGKTAGAYSGFTVGSQSAFIPYLQYTPGIREPLITIQNTGAEEAVIEMKYINRRGVTDFTKGNISIPVGGQKTFDLSAPGGEVPDLTDTDFFRDNGNWLGGVRIQAGSGQSVAAVVTAHWRKWSAMDRAVSQGDTKLLAAPNLSRRIVEGKAGERILEISYLSIQNMTAGNVHVKIDFYDRETHSLDESIERTLGPYDILLQNTRHLPNLDREPDDPAQDIWVGSATIEANGEVAATVVMLRQEIKASSQYSAVGPSSGGTKIFFPVAYRIYSGSTPVQWSLLRLQNTTDNNAQADIRVCDRDGNVIDRRRNQFIPANQSLGLNFKNLSDLGSGFTGTVWVTSDQPLVGVMDIRWSNQQLVTYNALSQ